MHKLQSTPIRANEELLNVISRKSRDAYECFLALLMTTNQPHLYQLLASSHDSKLECITAVGGTLVMTPFVLSCYCKLSNFSSVL